MPSTLDEAALGQTLRVVAFEQMPLDTARRLESLGMTSGVLLEVLNNKSHGCVVVRMRQTRWALGSSISRHIVVEPAARPHTHAQTRFLTHTSSQIGVRGVDGVLSQPKRAKAVAHESL